MLILDAEKDDREPIASHPWHRPVDWIISIELQHLLEHAVLSAKHLLLLQPRPGRSSAVVQVDANHGSGS
jgi:hypothetical protein